MTVAQKKNLLAQRVLQTENKHILKAIELLFSQEEEEAAELTTVQKREIDARLAEIESGSAKFYSLSEAKKIVRKKSRNK